MTDFIFLLLFLLGILTILMPVGVFMIWHHVSKASDTLAKMEHMMRHGK